MVSWFDNWKPGKPALLITGAPGIGKTSAVHALAHDRNCRLIEFNASDTRSERELSEIIPSLRQSGLESGNRIIVFDEVDGLSGNSDRGGALQIVNLISTTKVPVVCIANDKDATPCKHIAAHCLQVTFRRPTAAQLAGPIVGLARAGGVTISKEQVTALVSSTNNDIRQILNTLQTWTGQAGGEAGENAINLKIVDEGPFDATLALLSRSSGELLAERYRHIMSDSMLVPLMIHENYLAWTPTQRTETRDPHSGVWETEWSDRPVSRADLVPKLAAAADAFSVGDSYTGAVFGAGGNFALMRESGWVGTITPAWHVRGKGAMVRFPSILGKESAAKSARETVAAVSGSLAANTHILGADPTFVSYYSTILCAEVSRAGKEGVARVAGSLVEQGLEDADQIDFVLKYTELTKSGVSRHAAPPAAAAKTAFMKAVAAASVDFVAQKAAAGKGRGQAASRGRGGRGRGGGLAGSARPKPSTQDD